MPTKIKKESLKIIFKIFGYLVTLLAIVFVFWKTYNNWSKIIGMLFTQHRLAGPILGIFLYPLLFILIVFSWKLLISGLSGKITFKNSFVIYGKAQIAKYIPGNVFHYIYRLLQSKKRGISQEIIINSIFIETILLITVAIIYFIISIFIFNWLDIVFFEAKKLLFIILIAVIILIFIFLIFKFSPKWKKWLFSNKIAVKLNYIDKNKLTINILLTITMYFVFFIGIGSFLWFLARYLWADNNGPTLFIMSYAIAWVMGTVTVGAPGGIGIREAILVILLSNYIGEDKSLALALLFRLITVLGDCVFYLIANLVNLNFKSTGIKFINLFRKF